MKYITMSTDDLARLLELATNYPYAVIDSNDNTDGEGVWHCDVEFYDEQGDEDPTDVFSFNELKGEPMTNEELMHKVRKEYAERKAEINKDLHDYNYYELYMRYELCEWLNTIVDEYAEEHQELLDYLKEQANPLDWLYNVMLDVEEEMWDRVLNDTFYTMKWEKQHAC